MLVNEQWVIEENKKEIKNFLEINQVDNIIYQKCMGYSKSSI